MNISRINRKVERARTCPNGDVVYRERMGFIQCPSDREMSEPKKTYKIDFHKSQYDVLGLRDILLLFLHRHFLVYKAVEQFLVVNMTMSSLRHSWYSLLEA